MKYTLLITIMLCIVQPLQSLLCPPPQPGLPNEYVHDYTLQPKIGWGVEWWYYVLNTNVYMEYFPSATITMFVLRTPLENCTTTQNQLINMYIGINSPIFDPITYSESAVIDIQQWHQDKYLNITFPNASIIRYPESNATVFNFHTNKFIVEDNKGYYLQGDGGFTKSGPNAADNYYAGSFMNTLVKGRLENNYLVKGVGYGEHVFGSPNNTQPKIYSGWHCHYIHSNTPTMQNHSQKDRTTKDIQYCRSNTINGEADPYAHGLYVDEYNYPHNLSAVAIQFKTGNNWNGFPLNWTLDFVDPIFNMSQITVYPMQNLYNQTHVFDNVTWWDGGVTTEDEQYFGITELVEK